MDLWIVVAVRRGVVEHAEVKTSVHAARRTAVRLATEYDAEAPRLEVLSSLTKNGSWTSGDDESTVSVYARTVD